MKLLPLNTTTREQLKQEGFTHVILMDIVPAEERGYTTPRELYVFEAVMPGDKKLETHLADELVSDKVDALLNKHDSDYYISIGR